MQVHHVTVAVGFAKAYNIIDGVEGDTVTDPESVFLGKRMKNGWKNSAPWVYDLDPEKLILREGTVTQLQWFYDGLRNSVTTGFPGTGVTSR